MYYEEQERYFTRKEVLKTSDYAMAKKRLSDIAFGYEIMGNEMVEIVEDTKTRLEIFDKLENVYRLFYIEAIGNESVKIMVTTLH